MGNSYVMLAFLLIFPVVGTWWGWKNIILPIGFPLIKWAYKALILTLWIGFWTAFLSTGWFYRSFGVNAIDVLVVVTDDEARQRMLANREWNYDLEGNYRPGWNADGRHSSNRTSKMPPWSVLAIPGLTAGALWLSKRRRERREWRDLIMPDPKEARDELTNRLARQMEAIDKEEKRLGFPTIIPPQRQRYDNDLLDSLLALGYKKSVASSVMSMAQGNTVEDRIKSALKLLGKGKHA